LRGQRLNHGYWAASNILEELSMKVALPQTLVVVLGPPSPLDRLFILTGTAVEQFPLLGARGDDDFTRTPQVVVDLSLFHGHIFNPGISQVAVSAAPASFSGADSADDFAWAVDQAFAVIKPNGTLELHYDAAVAGEGGLLQRVAYQVFVQTNGVALTRFVTSPAAITIPANAAATFTLSGVVAPVPVGAPEPIQIQPDRDQVGIPPVFLVPPGAGGFSIGCSIPKDTFTAGTTTPLKITGTSSLNTMTAILMVTQL
jgi:hypothetical protein